MCKLNTLLRENLSNPDLNVPFIASAMAMSRTTLYSKFSHLSDVSVGDYVIRFRMVEASRLLSSHKDMSIQEVADRVGFLALVILVRLLNKAMGSLQPNIVEIIKC